MNRPTTPGCSVRAVVFALAVGLVGATSLGGQEIVRCETAEFNLHFQSEPSSGPRHQTDVTFANAADVVTVPVAPGETVTAKVWAAIVSRVGGAPGGGIQGWAIQARLTGDLTIEDATVAGTAADSAPAGLFAGGFQQTRIPNLRDETGFYSAVVLSFSDNVTLAPLGTATVLEVTLASPGPVTAASLPLTSRLHWVDGCNGCADPFVMSATARNRVRSFCSKAGVEVRLVSEAEFEAGDFVRCDPSNDGIVSLTDPVFVANHLFLGQPGAACADTEDCNGNQRIELGDVTFGLMYLFDKGGPLPFPFPDCGRPERTVGEESCRRGTTRCP